MHHLTTDMGLSWSHYAWPKITAIIPPKLFGGLHQVLEADLYKLPPFYAGMLHSYSKVNDLYYKENKKDFLPQNLWATNGSPSIHPVWKRYDLLLLSDLLVNEGKIDLTRITTILGNVPDTYLVCC